MQMMFHHVRALFHRQNNQKAGNDHKGKKGVNKMLASLLMSPWKIISGPHES